MENTLPISTAIGRQARRRDRWVDLLVIAVVLLALALGWAAKTAAEGRQVPVEIAGGRVRYPAGWVRADAQPPFLLRVEDRLAAGFRTALTIERFPLPPATERPLPAVQQLLALDRGSGWTAYRVLRVQEPASVAGQSGLRVDFAYVETNPDPFQETLPVVMHGSDYLFAQGDQVYVFTLVAAEANYERSQRALLDCIRSWGGGK